MPDTQPLLYPLRFKPIYKEKVWGGRTLERFGRSLPGGPEAKIGESWELVDLGTTSASGGGGSAERSVVAEGPLAGKTLHELMEVYGEALMGSLPRNEVSGGGEFPLLVKFLDANDNLSVQVHPSPAYAASHDDAFLKSEAWYVLDREPGAVIYKGIREGTTPEQFRQAIEDDTVKDLMIAIPVEPGDCHYLPSGTCHALGAGVLVAEVQTPSDTTFRVYDWGRPRKAGRELHIEQAMACIDFGPADTARYEPKTRVEGKVADITHLVRCEYFRIDRFKVDAGQAMDVRVDQPTVWMVLEGEGAFRCSGQESQPEVRIAQGQTLLLPPAMAHDRLELTRDTTWLEVTFPQARPSRLA